MMDYEVVWSGGELLPPRNEGMSPMWANMLTENEETIVRRAISRGVKFERGIVRTGRLCACGCGEEMVYSVTTGRGRYISRFKQGHNNARKTVVTGNCRYRGCAKPLPDGSTVKYCHAGCCIRENAAKHRARKAA